MSKTKDRITALEQKVEELLREVGDSKRGVYDNHLEIAKIGKAITRQREFVTDATQIREEGPSAVYASVDGRCYTGVRFPVVHVVAAILRHINLQAFRPLASLVTLKPIESPEDQHGHK